MAIWSRRRLLGAGLGTLGASWLPGCGRPEKGGGLDPSFDESCAFEDTLQSLLKEAGDAFVPLMKALRAGVAENTLYAIAMNASVRRMPPELDPDMHSSSPMRAAQLLALRQTTAHRLIPLFWAWDFVVELAPPGEPMPFPPDRSLWPAPENAAQALNDALASWDPEAADAAVSALYESAGPAAVLPPLIRYSIRPFQWIGHRAIWTAFAIRGLEDFGWDCAPWLLRSLARSLGGGQDAVGQAIHEQSLLRVSELPVGWRGGIDDPTAVPALLAEFRTGDSTTCTDAVIAALVAGASPRTVWTALVLAGVEIGIRWEESSFGVHEVDAMNALRHLQARAPDDETAAMCMLQAAAWCPLFRGHVDGDPPTIAEGIDTLAPASGTPTLDDAFAAITTDMTGASRMLLNWLEAGGDADELVSRWAELATLRAANADVHRIKYHAALLEESEVVLPEWRSRLLLGSPLRSPGSATPLWSRYDEAMALVATL